MTKIYWGIEYLIFSVIRNKLIIMEVAIGYKNKEEWDRFVARNTSPASFLQSFEWGEFNKDILGNEIQRWTVDDGTLKIAFMLIKKNLPGGRFYYYCPRGLIWQKEFRDERVNYYGKIIKKIKTELGDGVFMRTCPPTEFKGYMYGFMKRFGFRKPKILVHTKEPGKTLVLDLTKSEEELLKEMHQKTRYNIRLAEKKGVKAREMRDEKDIDIFCKLSEETAKRDKIHIYDRDHYMKLIKYFREKSTNMKVKLYISEFENKPLASAIMVYFGDTATYLHGASSNEHRNLMPNHLIQWQMIKDAKKRGMKLYDFWGVSEKNPQWAGITRFKKGFGGRMITFMGTWDYILDKKWYRLFRIMRLFKKIIP